MKKILLLIAGIAIVASMGTAGAYFTGQAQVPDNIIRAGTVSISTEPTAGVLSVESLAPGTQSISSLTVHNDGLLPSTFVVTGAKKAGITAFYKALTCTVTHGSSVLYQGLLQDLRTVPLALDVDERAEVQFAVGLPASAGNDLAGDYVKLTLYIDAEQAH